MPRVSPSVLFGVAAAAAAALRYAPWPRWAMTPWGEVAAAALGALSVLTALWSVRALSRWSGDGPVVSGPYRFSRHPMYVAMLGIFVAIGLALAELSVLAVAPFLWLALDRLTVRPEEAELEAAFPEAYARYRSSAPRWLGLPRSERA